MITGQIKSQIDQIWNTFWTGGISNTITIVEQVPHLHKRFRRNGNA
jgi:type I restriction enzyme M protein